MSVAKAGADDANCGNSNKDILHQAICRLVGGGDHRRRGRGQRRRAAPATGSRPPTTRSSRSRPWPTWTASPAAWAASAATRGAATTRTTRSPNFSNYGARRRHHRARQVHLVDEARADLRATRRGRRMAAPAVTGAVALYKASRPQATPAQVKEALQYLGNLNWKTSTDPDRPTRSCSTSRELGPLGTFGIVATQPAAVGEAAARWRCRSRIGRSATFFERVSLGIGSLPSGWTAALDKTSLLGWTATATTLRLALPNPTRAGTYHVTVSATNQGRVADHDRERRRRERPADAPGRGHRDRGQGQDRDRERPGGRQLVRRDRQDQRDPGYEIQFRKNGGAWYGVKTASSTVRSFRRSLAFNATVRGPPPRPRRRRQLEPVGRHGAVPCRARRRSQRVGEVHRVVGEDRLVGGHRATRSTARPNCTPGSATRSPVARSRPWRRSARVGPRCACRSMASTRRRSTCAAQGTHHRRVVLHEAVREQRNAQDHARDRLVAAGSSSTHSSSSSRRPAPLLQRA